MASAFLFAFFALWQVYLGDCNPMGPYGYGPEPFVVPASGSAISTGNALSGRSLTNSHTHTSPFGFSNSYANGLSEGYQPSSTSIANSDSGRRKRQSPLFDGSLIGYPFGNPYFGLGSGASLSSGSALTGRSDTDGRTFTDASGNTAALSHGSSAGNQPQSLSATGSRTNSGAAQLPTVPEMPRQKRQSEEYDDYMNGSDFDVEANVTGSSRLPIRNDMIVLELLAAEDLVKKASVHMHTAEEILKKEGVSRSLLERSDMPFSSAAEPSNPNVILPVVPVVFFPSSNSSSTTEKPVITGPSFANISIALLPSQ